MTSLAILAAFILGGLTGWLWTIELQHEALRRRLRMSKPEPDEAPQRMPTPKPTPTPTPPPPPK